MSDQFQLVNRGGRQMWKVGDRLFPYVAGGDGEGDGGGDGGEGDGGDQGGDGGDSDKLGDAGKRALAAERDRAKAAEKAAKAAQKERDEAVSRLEKLETDSKSDHEKALDKARKEAADAAKAEVMGDLHRERVNNALMRHGSKFADPEDALTIASEIEVGDDGHPDPKKVEKAVSDLLERKPHWAANGKKPAGSADGGARPSGKAETAPGVARMRKAYADSSKQ
jgi:hypothetical protein